MESTSSIFVLCLVEEQHAMAMVCESIGQAEKEHATAVGCECNGQAVEEHATAVGCESDFSWDVMLQCKMCRLELEIIKMFGVFLFSRVPEKISSAQQKGLTDRQSFGTLAGVSPCSVQNM